METKAPTKSLEEILGPIIEDMGFELVDLSIVTEAGRKTLRLLVDREGGINIDECAKISREIGPHLEVNDLVAGRYSLEVSSPGIRRPLKKPEDFTRFAGEAILLRTREPMGLEGRKRFRGRNRGLDDEGRLILEVFEPESEMRIDLGIIQEAKLDPEIKF